MNNLLTINQPLDELGNIPATYRHEWRVAAPAAPLVVPTALFKWYHVHREDAAIPTAMDAEARAVLADAATGGAWGLSYGLNFALVHLSTAHAFLIAGVWRGHQELWERIYSKDLAVSAPFTRTEMTGEDTPAACVWELGVICHERLAWHRYLFSRREEADKRAWLADTYAGPV